MKLSALTLLVAFVGSVLFGLLLAAIDIGIFWLTPFDPQNEPLLVVVLHWLVLLGGAFGTAFFCYRLWHARRGAIVVALMVFAFCAARIFFVTDVWFMKLAACCCCESIPSWVWVLNATINPTFPAIYYSGLY
ncbi:MAG: hypothetical protein V4805_18115 [Pseudomonadota bacterium]